MKPMKGLGVLEILIIIVSILFVLAGIAIFFARPVEGARVDSIPDKTIFTNKTTVLDFNVLPDVNSYVNGKYVDENVTFKIFVDRNDNNISFNGCGNYYEKKIVISRNKHIYLPVTVYYPNIVYTINYSVYGSSGNESRLLYLSSVGSVIDFNASTILCLKVNTSVNLSSFKREKRYGYNESAPNIVLERLKNHSIGDNYTILVNKTIVNTTNESISVVLVGNNTQINTSNSTKYVYTAEDLQITESMYASSTEGWSLLKIVIVVIGLCLAIIVGWIYVYNIGNR